MKKKSMDVAKLLQSFHNEVKAQMWEEAFEILKELQKLTPLDCSAEQQLFYEKLEYDVNVSLIPNAGPDFNTEGDYYINFYVSNYISGYPHHAVVTVHDCNGTEVPTQREAKIMGPADFFFPLKEEGFPYTITKSATGSDCLPDTHVSRQLTWEKMPK